MKYIIANWKAKMNANSILEWCKEYVDVTTNQIEIIVSPSFIHIPLVKEIMKNSHIAAQDVSIHTSGAHTGECTAEQLSEFCNYAIIGHSEREENIETTKEKIIRCIEANITPIICFKNLSELKELQNISKKTIWAWEDPDNISKNGIYNAKPTDTIRETVEEIRQIIGKTDILVYGGSVNGQNAEEIVNIDRLDGVLVGSASCNSVEFSKILDAIH